MTIDIREVPWTGPEATGLRDEMDAELRPRYAELFAEGHTPRPIDLDAIRVTLVAFDDGTPVGTTSLKTTDGFAEVKRVFVSATHRRGGLAARLLAAIEDWALAHGATDLVLQTGSRQPEAIALYEREGWLAIPPFGPYVDDPGLSRCYAKPLVPLTVAVELPASGQASELLPRATAAVRVLEAAGVDLVVVADDLRALDDAVRIDSPTLAAFLAPFSTGVAFAPVVSTTHTEPFHVAKVIQTLDHVSRGRAGWQVAVSTSDAEAELFGRRAVLSDGEAWAEADEAIEVAERLWDSWEDDAEIRDVATGRFIDRAKVHHIDFEGRFFSVRGPSIVPRSPQGRPPVIVAVTAAETAPEPAIDPAASSGALAVALRRADVIRVSAPDTTAAAFAVQRIRDGLAEAGRDSGDVTVLLDIAVLLDDAVDGSAGQATTIRDRLATVRHDSGADGVVLVWTELPEDATPVASALTPFTRVVASRTLRDRLDLSRPASSYARGATLQATTAPQAATISEGSLHA